MYDYNDEVANIMKHNIVESIVKYQNDFDKLNELMVLCGGIKYGDGYSIDDLQMFTMKFTMFRTIG